jgi:hypothetical protein
MSAYDFLQPCVHDSEPEPAPDETNLDNPSVNEAEPEPPDSLLVNVAKGSCSSSLPPPGDIYRVCPRIQNVQSIYKLSYHKPHLANPCHEWTVNGGVAGTSVRIVFKTGRTVDIRGVDNHQFTNILDIDTVGGVI